VKAAFEPLDVRFLERKNGKECWINSAENHTQGISIIQRVLGFLKTHGFHAVSMRLFGNQEAIAEASSFLETKMAEIVCPPLFILQNDSTKGPCLSVQVHAVSGAHLKPLYFENELVGRQFEDDYARYYMLRILPDNPSVSEYNQSQNVFEKAHKILKSLDSGFSETIRTWLFAKDILSWYSQLNKARNQFFEYHDIYNKLVPASTGIGVANSYNMALAAQFLAVGPKNKKEVSVYSVKSPLQCPALDYKSSFSRAIKLDSPDHSRLYISGTASIDKAGNTVFIDDTFAQLEFTMQVIKAILNEAGMDWSDTISSIVYFKNQRDFGLFDEYCRQKDIKLPHIKVQADMCRDDLLFELELDAVSVAP
jgi:enamine deaminase RidA (YjgF/YER057c/UK114 family)